MLKKTQPRSVPCREAKYMGMAWMFAGFSKDPSTQVGAFIVSDDNYPLGSGYNGPSREFADHEVIWDRPPEDNPDALSKYDMIVHAEVNAIRHTNMMNLSNSILYVTALPCPDCMLDIADYKISEVIYFDYQPSDKKSMLQNAEWRDKTFDLARRGKVKLTQFTESVAWMSDWVQCLKEKGVF